MIFSFKLYLQDVRADVCIYTTLTHLYDRSCLIGYILIMFTALYLCTICMYYMYDDVLYLCILQHTEEGISLLLLEPVYKDMIKSNLLHILTELYLCTTCMHLNYMYIFLLYLCTTCMYFSVLKRVSGRCLWSQRIKI